MSAKDVKFGRDARERILRGVDILADAVKVNIFLTDLSNFALVNKVMSEYFPEPYPARAAIGVASLPRGAAVEADCILGL